MGVGGLEARMFWNRKVGESESPLDMLRLNKGKISRKVLFFFFFF